MADHERHDDITRLRAMLKVEKTYLPGSPTPLTGMRDAAGRDIKDANVWTTSG